ncbi:MAG: BBP7 family outer membrane beta-barrel protein [Pirellulaceae bacterium]|nr:BBP7 family outer membrane beta-barrel protein [Pirellulaceae bacterium]
MFKRTWQQTWRYRPHVGSRNLMRAALLATLSTSVWSGLSQDASAQLRSGRTERPLYYDQVQQQVDDEVATSRPRTQATQSRSSAPATRARATGGRVRVVSDGPTRSIVEKADDDAAAQEPVAPKAAEAPPSVPAPSRSTPARPGQPAPQAVQPTPDPLPYDDNMASFDEGFGESYSHANGSGGCGCARCTGESYFSDLAPGTCGFAGDACGGPLSQLLSRLSVRAEVPLFWRRGIGLPPLVTTATAGTAANVAGRLGDPNTRILVGNQLATDDLQAGVRINVGTWFDPSCYRGVIFRYTNAGDQSWESGFDSNTNPILARPITNITSGVATADTQLVAFPGESSGNIRVGTASSVDGFDIVMRRLAYRDRFTRVDWLMGYQHNRIAESLNINSSTTVTGNVPPLTGTSIAVSDQFRTTNNFNGAVLGLMSSRQFAYWKFEAMGRMGLGSLERVFAASGSTTTTSSTGVVTTEDQGLLVRNTNNQTRRDETFVIAPEFGFNAGYCLTQNIDFTIGYNYLFIGKVAQPGRQIDSTVNLSDPFAGFSRPSFVLNTQNYWLHSLNLGMQWRY